MDYDDTNGEDVRNELYAQFRRSLSKPVSERFFDEDELTEVFDLASDRSDTYIQLEVLFCGARLYPESRALADRRALFYMEEDQTNELGRQYMEDNPEQSSPLGDIVRLAVNPPSAEHVPEALQFILDQYAVFTDEEIIRFVNVAIELGRFDWVVDNLSALRKKVNYLPSLLFEVLNEADNREEDELCIRLAEELIELEPFGMQYWALIFRAHARAGHREEARSAFDYARALGADRGQPMFWLAETVAKWANYLVDEAIQMLREAVEAEPDNYTYTECLSAMLSIKNEDGDEPEQLLRAFVNTHPEEWRPLRQLLFVANPEDAEQLLQRHLAVSKDPDETLKELEEMTPQLVRSGVYNTLTASMRILQQHEKLNMEQIEPFVETCFMQRNFSSLTGAMEEYMATTDITQTQTQLLTLVPATLIAYKMTGQEEKAAAFIELTNKAIESMLHFGPLSVRFSAFGVINLFAMSETHPASDTDFWHHFIGD